MSDSLTGTILVVDDNPENLDVVKAILSPLYTLQMATSGDMALKIISKQKPDLILLDIVMPDMNGLDLCQTIKASDELKDIPIIFLTAMDETADIVKGFDVGGVDYVTKPVNPPELKARVRAHLEIKYHQEETLRAKAETGELLHVLFHDLRNPFAAIISAAEVLNEVDDDSREEFEKMIADFAKKGLDIIDLVSSMQALEEGKMSCELQPVNLSLAVEESLTVLHNRFDSKNIECKVDVPSSIVVQANQVSLVNSVINNLLTNALKFSSPESVIEVFAEIEEGIQLTIRDYGMGMPTSILENLFKNDVPTNRRGTEGEKGTGFGMPLIRKFMVHYQGGISVQSWEEDEGENKRGTCVQLMFLRG